MSNQSNGNPGTGELPYDFAFRFDYKAGMSADATEGSRPVSDPSQSGEEYLIEVAPDGSGEIRYQNQGRYKTDEFVMIFDPTDEELYHLYHLMIKQGILQPTWQPPRGPAPKDSYFAHLDVTCGGNCYDVSTPQTLFEVERLEPVFEAIRGIVPDTIWAKARQP